MVSERSTARANPARGLALIATAVIIGFFLLRNGWDQSVPDVTETAEAGEATPGAGGDPAGGGGETTETTAPAAQPRPAAEVITLVVNTTTVPGAGGCITDQLTTREYQTRPATNSEPARDTTVVLFAAGFEADAAALAEVMQLAEPPAAIPNPPPVADLAGANLLILLGTDLAEGACG